ncbi:MAG TPA: hypothetical protein VFS20_33195 [Longimicrobium sp.]|nr:hypothetical protein [Longimicrobium sp.]
MRAALRFYPDQKMRIMPPPRSSGGCAGRALPPCFTLRPSTRNTTSSAMFVARSAMRSRLRLTRKSEMEGPIRRGSETDCQGGITVGNRW